MQAAAITALQAIRLSRQKFDAAAQSSLAAKPTFTEAHAVAAGLLGLIHRCIGTIQQRFIGLAGPIEHHHARSASAMVLNSVAGSVELG